MLAATLDMDFALDRAAWVNTPAADAGSRVAASSRSATGPVNRARVMLPTEQASSLSETLDFALAPAPWELELTEDLRRIAALKAGWDGPGSQALPNRALFLAELYVREALRGCGVVAPPALVPAGDGSIQIEWHRLEGEIELSIEPDGTFHIWGSDNASGTEFEGSGEDALALFRHWSPGIATRHHHGADVPAPPQARLTFAA